MDNHVLRLRAQGRAGGGGQGGQSGRPRPRLRPLAVYKPSFRLGDKLDDDEGQALLGPARATAAASVGAARSQPPPVPARRRREVAPSSGCPGKLGQDPWEGDRDGDGVGSNCCCGAVALPALPALPSGLGFPWARTSPPQPQPPPQHQPDKHKAMNTRGIFSHTLSGDPPAADTLLPPPHRHHHHQQQQQQQQQQLLRLQPPSRGPGAGGPGVLGTGREERGGSTPLLGPPPPWSATASGTATRVPDGPGAPVPAAAPAVGGAARSVRRYSDDPGDDTARDEDADDEDGVRKMLEAPRRKELPPLPPLPSTPLKRRVLVRTKQDLPTYGVAALLPHAPPAAAAPPGAPVPAGPMDRFNKFRFGGRVDDIKKSNGRTPRTSDKTERLRELTGRLRAGPERADRGGGGAGGDRAPAPPTPSPSPSPSPSPTPAVSASPAPAPAAAAATAPAGAGPPQADSAAKEDDLFDLRLARPESRAIVGSYIQRTIPFRSASFSQVDFTDGKYFRHSPRATWLCPLSAATLPRKKAPTDEASPVTSSASIAAVETPGAEGSAEPTGSTPSVDSAVESAVDSAVGSDEGCFEPAVLSLMGPPRVAAKPPGSRSMTHPLPSRTCAARADRGSPLSSSVEADGLRGLRHPCQGGAATPESLLADSRPDSGALLGVVADPRLSNSTSSMESDAEAAARDASAGSFGSLGPPTTTAGTNEGDIKPLENPVSYEVFVRQFPNYKEYEKWMNESVLANDGAQAVCKWQHPSEFTNGNSNDSNNNPAVQTDSKPAAPEPPALASAPALTPTPIPDVVEHDDRCINYFDPTTCPKCLEQMETGPSILQKLKASFHMEDLELEPHEKELYSRHTDLLLRKWAPTKAKHPFERSKSEPKETGKEDAKAVLGLAAKDPMTFQRTKSTDEAERESAPEPPLISLPSSDEKDTPEPRPPLAGAAVGAGNSAAGQSHADEELKRRRPKDEPRPRRWLERPKLICQSSDERDDESSAGSATPAASRPRFPLVGRSDSLSEGESDQCDRRPSTPSRTSPSPSLYPHLDLSDSEGAGRAGAHAPPQGHGHGAASQRSPHTPRRYSKRPLRGPYGQMLEAEMKKPEANRKLSQYTDDLKFLEEYPSKASGSSQSLVVLSPSAAAAGSAELTRSVSSGEQRQAAAPRNRHQGAGAHSMDDSQLRAAVAAVAAAAPSVCLGPASAAGSAKAGAPRRKVSATELPFACLNPNGEGAALPVCHQRTTSSPSQLEGIAARADVDLFRRQAPRQRSKEEAIVDPANVTWKDTRTHVVVELYETERSYVESLDFLVKEYMQPLKKPENAGMVDSELVEQIFYQVPAILLHHREFLDDLQKRLENWDFQQKVGDVLLSAFTKRSVIETYTAFINNWKTAKEAIKSTCQAKPAFARYLEAMAREHKGKLALDSLLIMPVQRIPRYELLIQTLLKHTDPSHADHGLLLDAQREVHELAVKINCTERESLEAEQQQQTLRDLEALVEGCDLVSQGRVFLRHDLVTLASGQGTRKERVLFLFSDLVVIARIKRNLRKPSAAGSSTSVASGLEGNRYRCSMKATLDDLEIVKAKDESIRRVMREMEQLSEDVAALTQVTELAAGLHAGLHPQQQQQQQQLEELARDMLSAACRQLAERQNSDSQLSCLDLTVNTTNGVENITVIFTKPDKRASWEESFNEAKTRLALSADRRPSPKFKTSVPIRKTRAGLQFTCAAPTLAGPGAGPGGDRTGAGAGAGAAHAAGRDVWVCNSDGYVGQVCVLSLAPEPNVTSCNGVCNARILCVAAIPAGITGSPSAGHNQSQFTNSKAGISISVEDTDKSGRNLHLDSSSSSSDEDDDNDSTTEERQRLRSNTAESQGSAPGVLNAANGNAEAPSPGPAPVAAATTAAGVSVAAAAAGAGGAAGPAAASPPSSASPGAPGAPGAGGGGSGVGDDGLAQPTMWLGTEDGCIHVYSCNDNIRIKRNKIKIQHGAAVHCIMYFDNRVFVSLANGDITVYSRDSAGGWNTTEPYTVTVGSAACPVTRMVPISGRLWCSCQHTIKILNTYTLQVEQTVVAADSNRSVTCFVVSGLAVWLSVQNSAVLKLYHASTFEHLGDVNVAPAVTKMLASCDDIIRQHKAACLRVTSLLACKDLLWIGTSAGVVLTMPLPHVAPATTRLTSIPNVLGVPHGHTGHVRFLTVVEAVPDGGDYSTIQPQFQPNRHSWKGKSDQTNSGSTNKLLVISGGDGYEDFRTSSVSEVAGKEDSTNHLLMWQV